MLENRVRLFLQPPALRLGTHCSGQGSGVRSQGSGVRGQGSGVSMSPHLSEGDLHILGHVHLAVMVEVRAECADTDFLGGGEGDRY